VLQSSTFQGFLRAHLPPPPARVLDVGSGHGELTTALAVAGYEVLGIDPVAPAGDLFRRVRLEDLEDEDGPFDAVAAVHSLHHIRDLGHALDRIAALLRPSGVLVLDEFGWDRLDERSLVWLHEQRRAYGGAPGSLEELRAEWEEEHLGVHGYAALRREVDARFEERAFEWSPFLYRQLGGPATEVLERELIAAGELEALGFRYAGVPREPRYH
jgi:SAM-dependent methyltransferase